MFVDTQNEFSDAQAVTATAISTNVIDTQAATGGGANIAGGNATMDFGLGGEVYLVVTTSTACTDTGSDATLTVTLESATDAGLTTGAVVHFSTGAIPFATFSPAGARVAVICLPIGDYKRYLGLRYTVANGPLTAGAFDAFLTTNVQRSLVYKSAFTVQ